MEDKRWGCGDQADLATLERAAYLFGRERKATSHLIFLKPPGGWRVGVCQASESQPEILLDFFLNQPPWAFNLICCFSIILSGSPNPVRRVVLLATD